MPLAERAVDLVKELTRDNLPPYNEEKIRQVITEINALKEDITNTLRTKKDELASPYIVSNILVQDASIFRNKECVCAYLLERMYRIQRLRWELDDNIPPATVENLSRKGEREFLVRYDLLLGDYMRSVGIDLTLDQVPPKTLLIEVRVLQDCKMTQNGIEIPLRASTTHLLRKSEAEPLIRHGFLEHILH